MIAGRRRLLVGVLIAAAVSVTGCDEEGPERTPQDPQGPAEQAPGTELPEDLNTSSP